MLTLLAMSRHERYRNQFHTFLHFGVAVSQAVTALDETAVSISRLFAYNGVRGGLQSSSL